MRIVSIGAVVGLVLGILSIAGPANAAGCSTTVYSGSPGVAAVTNNFTTHELRQRVTYRRCHDARGVFYKEPVRLYASYRNLEPGSGPCYALQRYIVNPEEVGGYNPGPFGIPCVDEFERRSISLANVTRRYAGSEKCWTSHFEGVREGVLQNIQKDVTSCI